MLNKWSSISPPISDKFIKRAELECVQRKRNSYKEPSPTSKKKNTKAIQYSNQARVRQFWINYSDEINLY